MADDRPFYYWLPSWMLTQIQKKNCSQCGIPYTKECIIAFGFRQIEDSGSLFIEHNCPKCDHIERISFAMEDGSSIKDVCYYILEENKSKRRVETARQARDNKTHSDAMGSKEVNAFLKFLQGSSSHEEVMRHIGCEFDQRDEAKKKASKKKRGAKKKKPRKPSNKKRE